MYYLLNLSFSYIKETTQVGVNNENCMTGFDIFYIIVFISFSFTLKDRQHENACTKQDMPGSLGRLLMHFMLLSPVDKMHKNKNEYDAKNNKTLEASLCMVQWAFVQQSIINTSYVHRKTEAISHSNCRRVPEITPVGEN